MANIGYAELVSLLVRIFVKQGVPESNAGIIAEVMASAERDGSLSHGLTRLNGYVSTLQSGWADGSAVPIVADASPGLVVTDAQNGFAQIALARSRSLLVEKVREQGIAALAIRNSHHFAALWPDIEPFAEEQLIALTTINTRSYMMVWGSKKKILGTNPMAFACPRRDNPPVVWDQASSPMSHGDLLLALRDKRRLSPGVAVDRSGAPTIDPEEVLDGGAFLAFGGHKGSAIAFMVEILSAAFTGGRFGYDDRVAGFPGGKTSHAGQFVMLLDPKQTVGEQFFDRMEEFLAHLKASGVERLPGEKRHLRRKQSEAEGIPIKAEHRETLQKLIEM